MSEYVHIGDYDVFLCGKLFTTFYDITLGEVIELVSYFPCDSEDIDVVLRV